MSNLFQCVIDAKISAQEVVNLLDDAGVEKPSRMAAYLWIRGAYPSAKSMNYLRPFLRAVTKAVEDKVLPLPITVKRVDRYKELQNAVFPRMESSL